MYICGLIPWNLTELAEAVLIGPRLWTHALLMWFPFIKAYIKFRKRFWDNGRDKEATRYNDSVFLGQRFKIGLSKLTSANLLQVSMDGLSKNWKFYESLLKDRKVSVPDLPTLINVDCMSCMGLFS